MIRRAQHIGIVLHHQDRVAQVAQLFKNVNQPRRVARMQPDRRLIQHIQRAHQPRPQRSRQLNPLRLAAAKASKPAGPASGIPAPPHPENSAAAAPRPESARQSPPASATASAPSKNSFACAIVSAVAWQMFLPVRAAPPAPRPAAAARGNPGTPHSRDTCSASRARAACTSCAPSAQRSRTRPRSPPLPRSTVSRAASGNRATAHPAARPAPPPACADRVNQVRYLGRFHGSIAPSFSLSPLSGITRFRSKSTVLPNPWQRGHAPNGLLKLNSRGSGSFPADGSSCTRTPPENR